MRKLLEDYVKQGTFTVVDFVGEKKEYVPVEIVSLLLQLVRKATIKEAADSVKGYTKSYYIPEEWVERVRHADSVILNLPSDSIEA